VGSWSWRIALSAQRLPGGGDAVCRNPGVGSKGDEEWFVAQKVIENAGQESGVGGRFSQHCWTYSSKGEETAQSFRFTGEKAKSVDRQQFRRFGCEMTPFF
jgi:hypothetical protein